MCSGRLWPCPKHVERADAALHGTPRAQGMLLTAASPHHTGEGDVWQLLHSSHSRERVMCGSAPNARAWRASPACEQVMCGGAPDVQAKSGWVCCCGCSGHHLHGAPAAWGHQLHGGTSCMGHQLHGGTICMGHQLHGAPAAWGTSCMGHQLHGGTSCMGHQLHGAPAAWGHQLHGAHHCAGLHVRLACLACACCRNLKDMQSHVLLLHGPPTRSLVCHASFLAALKGRRAITCAHRAAADLVAHWVGSRD